MKRSNIRDLDIFDLEHVGGGIAIGGIASVSLPANGVPAVALSTGAPQGFPVPGEGFGGAGFWMEGHRGHGDPHGEDGDREGDRHGEDGDREGGWHGGGHGGGHVMHELFQDPAVQGALHAFAGQHPEMAGALDTLEEGHGPHALMHQPEGRALIGQFFQDPAFADAIQQFSTAHPQLAGRVEHMLARIDSRAAGGFAQPQSGIDPVEVEVGSESGAGGGRVRGHR